MCGPGTFYDERRTTLLDPVVLVEVLSPSTEPYDRTTECRFYRQIESLKAYVLVSQDAPSVDVIARAEAGWTLTTDVEGRIALPALDVSLKLSGLYEGVAFPGSAALDRPAPRA